MKKQSGITLIALIITIILMLILAGIVIRLSIGENGIFARAKNARIEHIRAELEEELQIKYSNEVLQADGEAIDFDEFMANLPEEYNIQGSSEPYLFTRKGYDYEVTFEENKIKVTYIENGYENNKNYTHLDVQTTTRAGAGAIESSNAGEGYYNSWVFDDTYPTNFAAYTGCWLSRASENDSYIGYNFNEPVCLYKVKINSCMVTLVKQYSFVIQGMNRDGTWENINNIEYLTNFTTVNEYETNEYDINTNKAYYAFRIKNNYSQSGHGEQYWHITSTSCFAIGELNFYCWKSENKLESMSLNVQTTTRAGAEAIESSNQGEGYYNSWVFDDTYPTNFVAYTGCWISGASEQNSYIGYNFNEPVYLYKMRLHSSPNGILKQYSFVIQGMNREGTWENIDNNEYLTDFTTVNEYKTNEYDINTNKAYYAFRIKNNYSESGHGDQFWHISGTYSFGIGELNFYVTTQK